MASGTSVACVLAVWVGYVVGLFVGSDEHYVIRSALGVVFVVALWIAWRRERRLEALDKRAMDEMRAAQARRTEAGS